MRHGDVNYERWNPEVKALLVFQLLWFAHGALVDANKLFVWSWMAHWLVNAVWGLSYLWRTGTQRHLRWRARQLAMQHHFATRPCHVCGTAAGECHICHALPGEPCDAGLHG